MKVEGKGQIVRYNVFLKNLYFAFSSAVRPPRVPEAQDARIYGNTVFGSGLWTLKDYGNPGNAGGNEFLNNLVIPTAGDKVIDIRLSRRGRNPLEDNRFTSNAFSVGEDFKISALNEDTLRWLQLNTPNFTRNLVADPVLASTDEKSPEYLNLSGKSPLIDRGASLTQARVAGSGNMVSVQDAGWFSDGFGVVSGDLIQIGANPPVRVMSVSTTTDTLVFAQGVELQWNKGDGVSLPYSGRAPDIGAYEYIEDKI
jgi:hypothetical protein